MWRIKVGTGVRHREVLSSVAGPKVIEIKKSRWLHNSEHFFISAGKCVRRHMDLV